MYYKPVKIHSGQNRVENEMILLFLLEVAVTPGYHDNNIILVRRNKYLRID